MPEPADDFYLVIHVWTTCDEHGVCVSKDSAEVIEIAWILLNSKTLEEVFISFNFLHSNNHYYFWSSPANLAL